MPLVRYRIGDRGSLLPGRCSCGVPFPRLAVVSGRAADVLEMSGRRISPYSLTCALEAVSGLLRYQVIQLDHLRLRVHGKIDAGADRERIAKEAAAALREAVGDRLEVEVEFVHRFETGPGGKFRVVQALTSGDGA
jgi:phenylacetate-CoA ligase